MSANPLSLEAVKNFRPLLSSSHKELVTRSDGSVRFANKPKVWRVADITNATPSDMKVLEEHVTTYLDLRSCTTDAEIAELESHDVFTELYKSDKATLSVLTTAMRYPGQHRRVNVPLAQGLMRTDAEAAPGTPAAAADAKAAFVAQFHGDIDPATGQPRWRADEALHEDFLTAFTLNVLEHNGGLLLKALMLFTDERNYPIAFGCSAGKDRTGIVACLLQLLLGVGREEIRAEYLLSNAAGLTMGAAGTGTGTNARRSQVYPRVVESMLDWLDAEHGGVEGYLSAIGFRPKDFEAVRRNLRAAGASSKL